MLFVSQQWDNRNAAHRGRRLENMIVKIMDIKICFLSNRWFSGYVIAAMLVGRKQKISHWLLLLVH